MFITYIAAITRSVYVKCAANLATASGFAASACASVALWMKPKMSRNGTPMASSARPLWLRDDARFNLMLCVINQVGITLNRVQGFRLSRGRWHICLEQIGWLRTSDLLSMHIKLYQPPERAK